MPVSKQFVLAGTATFSITDPDGKHRTYRVEKVEATARWPEAYFVKTLTGPDNTGDYTYVGKLDPVTGQVRTTAKSRNWDGTMRLRLLNRVLARVWANDHAAYEAHGYKCQHTGHCGRCGRLLTVPSSVDSGIGPDCAEKMGLVVKKGKPAKEPKAKAKPQPSPEVPSISDASDGLVDTAGMDPHYDREGELTHWTGVVDGKLVMVVND